MKFFSYDGILARSIAHIWFLVMLNFMFLICCLPVVTIGASFTALYSVFLNQSVEEGKLRQFLRAFRDNFLQATLIWLVFLGLGGLLGLSAYFLLTHVIPGGAVFNVLWVISSVFFFSVMSFVFPLQAHYENKVPVTIKNALVLGASLVLHGIIMTVLTYFPAVVFFFHVELATFILLFWLPLGFSLSAEINSKILTHVFKKITGEA